MINTAELAPGVYVDPLTVVGPIVGTGTSTVAFIGRPANAPVSAAPPADPPAPALITPTAITNWTAYASQFGTFESETMLPYAMRGFFENGGALAYVVPVGSLSSETVTRALDSLSRVPEVKLVCAPGLVDPSVQNLLIAHCEKLRNRFAILDGKPDGAPYATTSSPLQDQVGHLTASAFAGVYWPWIAVDSQAAAARGPLLVPPSGHVGGIMARSDGQYGVHKAPANEPVVGARDLAHLLNDTEQGQLNAHLVNALRRFPGRPPVVWGARTLSSNTAWRYVNVRRLVSYIEESLTLGLQWAVFAPNNTALWKGMERTVTEFLTRVWLSGALFGRTAKDAFYVRIDEELNPPDVRARGEVYIEVGLAPVEPAEFVIVQLGLVAADPATG